MILSNSKKQSVYAFVFARGGSKGVPKKNIRELAGKPLISYAINSALSSSLIDRVIVSTDDPEIAAIAEEYGAEVPFLRPAALAKDNSSEWLSWQHALEFLKENGGMPDIFLSVPPTAPMREVYDLEACLEKLVKDNFDIVITASEAARNPYFNMIKINFDGVTELAITPDKRIVRRQDAPDFYDIATVAYASKPVFILQSTGLFQGKVGTIIIPSERALDIDTLYDFKVADILMEERRALNEKY